MDRSYAALCRPMPDVDGLMQEWPTQFEDLLKEVRRCSNFSWPIHSFKISSMLLDFCASSWSRRRSGHVHRYCLLYVDFSSAWWTNASLFFSLSFFSSTSGYPRLWITDSIVAFSLHTLPWIQEFRSKSGRKERSHVHAAYCNYLSSISKQWWMLNQPIARMETIQKLIRWLSIEPCSSYMYILALHNSFFFLFSWQMCFTFRIWNKTVLARIFLFLLSRRSCLADLRVHWEEYWWPLVWRLSQFNLYSSVKEPDDNVKWVLKCFGWWSSSAHLVRKVVHSSRVDPRATSTSRSERILRKKHDSVCQLFLFSDRNFQKYPCPYRFSTIENLFVRRMKYPSRLYLRYLVNPPLKTFSVVVHACVTTCLWS